MSRLEDLSERYGEHHRAKRTREFVYAGEERAELFRQYVGGPGCRVLDLGCRYGALTRAYAQGNDVTGVDVDRDCSLLRFDLDVGKHGDTGTSELEVLRALRDKSQNLAAE